MPDRAPSRERNLILGALAAARSSAGGPRGHEDSVDDISDMPTSAVDPGSRGTGDTSIGPASITPMGGALGAGRKPQGKPGGKSDQKSGPDEATSADGDAKPLSEQLSHVFPGYEVLEEIHRGGQGVVYKALQLTTKRKVAIKVMHGGATMGSAGKARFEREVLVLGQLNHPNIVKLHDSGVTNDGSFFYVMDYISGKPLDQIIREQRRAAKKDREAREARETTRHGRSRAGSRVTSTGTHARTHSRTSDGGPSIRETIDLFARICDAVNAAHLRGVIHRDLKPANVRIDARGEPIVVDFGLAKTAAGVESDIDAGQAMTMTGQFVGSLPWASPEQAAGGGEAVDVRTDVYSLGVMLFQMLTGGKFPYPVVGNIRDVLDNIQRAEPRTPSSIRKRINDEVETIILKALAKERDRRYQNAGELGRDLERYLRGEAIEAKRDSGWYVIQKTVKRHKVPAAFVATLAVLTLAFGAGMSGLYARAETARRDEASQRAQAVAQRDRAEENLAAVRDLANTFIFDFHDAIENLRGATRARELVLEKAVNYLDSVEAQAIDDPVFLLDLADAHDKVGALRGGLYEASTGTTAAAQAHFAEARRIRERVLVADADNARARRGLAQSYASEAGTLLKQQRFDEAIEAWTNAGELAAQAGDLALAAEATARVGDLHERVAQRLKGQGEYERALERMGFADARYENATAAWGGLGQSPDARLWEARLLQKRSRAALTRAEILRQRDGAWDEASTGLVLRAASLGERSAEIADALLGAEPASGVYAHEVTIALDRVGIAYTTAAEAEAERGNDGAAIALRERALDAFEQRLKIARQTAMDPSNLEAQRNLGLALNKVGVALEAMGSADGAAAVYRESAEVRDSLAASDPIARHERDQAVAHVKLGNLLANLAKREQDPERRDALSREALEQYVRAEALAERGVLGSGYLSQIREEIEKLSSGG